MFPAFVLQRKLREGVLGEQFWEAQYKKRAKFGAAAMYSIWDVLKALDSTRLHHSPHDQSALHTNRYGGAPCARQHAKCRVALLRQAGTT